MCADVDGRRESSSIHTRRSESEDLSFMRCPFLKLALLEHWEAFLTDAWRIEAVVLLLREERSTK
jgi:hypothetical protein